MIDINTETLFLSDDRVFYTIEGEGEYVGKPSVFMRVAMCNLTCKGFASPDSPNGCDSFVSWSIKNKMTFAEIFQLVEENNYIEHLRIKLFLRSPAENPLYKKSSYLNLLKLSSPVTVLFQSLILRPMLL